MPFTATWMDTEIIILSEVTQKERNTGVAKKFVRFFHKMVCKNQNKLFSQLNTIYHLHLESKISHSELSIYKTETDSQT